jgi:hypothetical protein
MNDKKPSPDNMGRAFKDFTRSQTNPSDRKNVF